MEFEVVYCKISPYIIGLYISACKQQSMDTEVESPLQDHETISLVLEAAKRASFYNVMLNF